MAGICARSMITARQVDRPMVMLGLVEGKERNTFDFAPGEQEGILPPC